MILPTLARLALRTATASAAALAVSRYTPGYTPSRKQNQLHDCRAKHVLYGGAAGGGKSRAMREDAWQFCHQHPGATVGFFRRTRPELRDTHILKLRAEWPVGAYKLNKADYTLAFPNGATIIFGHCHTEDDVYRYLGTEYDRLYFDELTTFTETQYDMLCSRLRSVLVSEPQVIAGTNPGGIGHNWVKTRWIDRAAPDHIDLGGYQFIQATLDDHPDPAFKEQYRATLMGLPEAKRRAYLDGDWDVFEGQYFREWRRDVHVVRPFPLPDGWPRLRGLDFGSTAPLACLWAALDPACGRVYIYREHYVAGQLLRAHCERINALSAGERYAQSVADPSMAAKSQVDGSSLLGQAARYGLHLTPANNDRLAGWQLMNELMGDSLVPCPITGRLPRLLVFDTCPNLVRTIPLMVHDAQNVEDVQRNGLEDHACDAARYLLMAAFPRTGKQGGTAGAPTARMLIDSDYARGL